VLTVKGKKTILLGIPGEVYLKTKEVSWAGLVDREVGKEKGKQVPAAYGRGKKKTEV